MLLPEFFAQQVLHQSAPVSTVDMVSTAVLNVQEVLQLLVTGMEFAITVSVCVLMAGKVKTAHTV